MLIAVCDDEIEYCNQVENFMTQLGQETSIPIHCDKYTSGEQLLKSDFNQYQIVFLDINIQKENGIRIAEEIRKINQRIEIIFLTAFIQYALDGYRVKAYRFLLKPIEYEDFVFQTKELLLRLHEQKQSCLSLVSQGQKYEIKIEEIYYIEVLNHELTYHCIKGDISINGNLKKVAEQLEGCCFARIHNAYLVNMRQIEKVKNKEILLKDGSCLPLARTRQEEFRQRYLEFWGDELG
ncbi:MAG: LytTR family DNA-binding domain-containing protein [Roseburia sp.]|nr:LytTR family DNA-binding domain-containing protein [Roseburia sp.]MCM1277996.1 LytTR family DNA-binding domain-containing protein [Robinsoniella sp.]